MSPGRLLNVKTLALKSITDVLDPPKGRCSSCWYSPTSFAANLEGKGSGSGGRGGLVGKMYSCFGGPLGPTNWLPCFTGSAGGFVAVLGVVGGLEPCPETAGAPTCCATVSNILFVVFDS